VIVVDASAVADMLVYADERGRRARAVLGRDPEWVAPEHVTIETFSVIRGLALGRKIDEQQAVRACSRLPDLGIEKVAIEGLLGRMWQLRQNVSAYDAAYLALAEATASTLVTCDGRLARAATAYCRVELAAASR
jgi:predicted nucleic acid-binding protein